MPAGEREKHQAALACPPLPAALDYLWQAFNRIRRRTGGGGFGRSPISWSDIDAFLRHAKLDLAPFEIEILEDLDDLFLKDYSRPKAEDA